MFNYLESLKLLEKYSYAYYNTDTPLVSDAEFDAFQKALVEFEKTNGIIRELGIGSKGYDCDIKHKFQDMYSLDNVTSKDELIDFFNDYNDDLVVTPKLDGIAIALYYNGGSLEVALTRGDGEYGKDITHLIMEIDSVPKRIDYYGPIRIEGEAYCFSFQKGEYKNHRNYVAGALRLKNPETFKNKQISIVVYNAVFPNKRYFDYYTELLEELIVQGFNVVDWFYDRHSPDEYKDKFSAYPFTDGVVYKVNNTKYWTEFTSHHPKFAVAYKFPEEEHITKLLNVEWSIGKLKKITPVAIVEPIDIEGATVSRASLANMNIIKALGICVGDKVRIIRAKSVIPQIVGLAEKGKIRIPIELVNCPRCSKKLTDINGQLFCKNESCCGSLDKQLDWFCKTLDIKGLGIITIKQLVSNGAIKSPNNIITLTVDSIIDNSSMGKANAPKVIAAIKESFKQPRYKLWAALSIPQLGVNTAKLLFQNNILTLTDVEYDDLIKIQRIGPVTASGIVEWSEANADILLELEGYYNNISKDRLVEEGKGNIVITGTMDIPRKYIKEQLESKGWKIQTNITKKTDYVLAGKNPGSKLDKAREYGIPIIDYFLSRNEFGI